MDAVVAELPHPHVWRQVNDWLDEHSEHRSPRGLLGLDSLAILVGPSGVGKSYGIRRLLAAKGWNIREIDQENTPSAKDLPEVVRKAITTNLVQTLIGEVRPRALLWDNADALFQNERMYAQHLVELLGNTSRGLPHAPIVLTCSYATEKKLGGLRRCQQFVFRALSDRDLFLYLKRNHRLPAQELMSVAEAAQGSLGAALQMLSSKAEPGSIPRRDVAVEHPLLYQARQEDVRQIRSLIGDRLWMSPLLFHENLPAELERRRGSQRVKREYYRAYLWALATWDVWMASEGTTCEEASTELITRAVLAMGEVLPRKTQAAGGSPAPQELFTRLFSTLSIQKKTARMAYQP